MKAVISALQEAVVAMELSWTLLHRSNWLEETLSTCEASQSWLKLTILQSSWEHSPAPSVWFLLAVAFTIFSLNKRKRESTLQFSKSHRLSLTLLFLGISGDGLSNESVWHRLHAAQDGKGFPGVCWHRRMQLGTQWFSDGGECGHTWMVGTGTARQVVHEATCTGKPSDPSWAKALPLSKNYWKKKNQKNNPHTVIYKDVNMSALKWSQRNELQWMNGCSN